VLRSDVHVLNCPNKSYGAAHFQVDKGWNHVQASKVLLISPLNNGPLPACGVADTHSVVLRIRPSRSP
jgi:hypothetical protein